MTVFSLPISEKCPDYVPTEALHQQSLMPYGSTSIESLSTYLHIYCIEITNTIGACRPIKILTQGKTVNRKKNEVTYPSLAITCLEKAGNLTLKVTKKI